eukprot:5403243-Amphidinium_carterae.1
MILCRLVPFIVIEVPKCYQAKADSGHFKQQWRSSYLAAGQGALGGCCSTVNTCLVLVKRTTSPLGAETPIEDALLGRRQYTTGVHPQVVEKNRQSNDHQYEQAHGSREVECIRS